MLPFLLIALSLQYFRSSAAGLTGALQTLAEGRGAGLGEKGRGNKIQCSRSGHVVSEGVNAPLP